MKKKIIITVFLILLVGVGALVYFGQWQSQRGELYYSGTIEATNSNLAFQTSGRVTCVAVREGYAVKKDQLLAEIDGVVAKVDSVAQQRRLGWTAKAPRCTRTSAAPSA